MWGFFVILILMLSVALTGAQAHADDVEPCFEPGRNTELCLQMRHLRNLLYAFDTQRELVRVNYDYLACMADDLDSLLGRVLRSAGGNGHVAPLNDLQSMVRLVKRKAGEGNLEAVRLANRFQLQCQRCHTPTSPEGRRWSDLTQLGWAEISKRCNEGEHNPFICRNMHAMLGQVQLLESASQSGSERYETISAAAGEMERIARQLVELGGVHGGVTTPLVSVAESAAFLRRLADARQRESFIRASQVSVSCRQCHNENIPGGGAK